MKMLGQKHLAIQDLENLDISQITPLSPEIISRQATINIGTIGHVAHGKSTLVRAISNTNVSSSGYILLNCMLTLHMLDCPSQTRTGEKHYNQVRLCKCQAIQM